LACSPHIGPGTSGVHTACMGKEDSMKRRKFTATQIVGMLREADALLSTGKTIGEVCRHLTIAESSYYQWRAQYAGVEPDQAKRLKELEEENRRLKKLVAEQALDISILRETARGNY
jgi:putative transposase